MDENDVQVRERLTALESSYKSLHKRVDKQEELIENIQNIVTEVKYIREDLNSISTKVDDIEQKPAKRWDLVLTGLISTVVTAIAMAIINGFMAG